jgi:hypothetical protein
VAQAAGLPETRAGIEWQRARLQLVVELDRTLNALRRDTAALLDAGMIDLAQAAADTAAATEAVANRPADIRLAATMERTFSLSTGETIQVRFGSLARSAVERLAARYYADGLKLSDRLYRLDSSARKAVEDTLIQGLAEQASGRTIAARLQDSLAAAGADNPRYQAMRIARTEIANAHREATVLSSMDEGGVLKPHIAGLKWNLSLSHTNPDVCDAWAAHDSGLGPGVYLPDAVPVDHPHGLCFITKVLREFPDVAGPSRAPEPEAIPASELAYYADRGDPAAQALAAGGAAA